MDFNKEIESWFPNISGKPYKIYNANSKFNCVAFTLDYYEDFIWTNEKKWPKQIPRNLKLEGFKILYELCGYENCDSEIFEEGYDKIAFYSDGNNPLHAAKQFKNMWRSKLGDKVIIEHKLDWLCGDSENSYGEVAFIMKRKIGIEFDYNIILGK